MLCYNIIKHSSPDQRLIPDREKFEIQSDLFLDKQCIDKPPIHPVNRQKLWELLDYLIAGDGEW